jgi:hypothetical protein
LWLNFGSLKKKGTGDELRTFKPLSSKHRQMYSSCLFHFLGYTMNLRENTQGHFEVGSTRDESQGCSDGMKDLP